MFARQVFRAAAPIRTQARGYASQSSSGGGSMLGYAAVGAGFGLGGYYYYTSMSKGSAKELVNKAKGASYESAFKGGDQGFLSLKLEEIEKINHNTSKFRFALEDNQVSGLPVASAVITKFKGENDEKPTIRPYTPTSPTDAVGYVDFVVKKYPNGPMSEYIHNMKPGQTLDVKGPIPKVPVSENKYDHIAMIAGGTGITPMWQIAQAIFANPNDKTKVTLVYGNISEDDILLRKELQQLENTYPQRFRAFYTLDKPPKDWSQGKGFITKELLKTVLPEPKTENILIGVCGPPGLMKAVSGAKKSPKDQGELEGSLQALGYSKEQVFKF